MSIRDWLPWKPHDNQPAVAAEEGAVLPYRGRMNQLFDDFVHDFEDQLGLTGMGAVSSWPRVDVQELADRITITAELPGIGEKDVEVLLSPHCLTLKGEKQHEKESHEGGYHRMERRYGAFRRDIQLPADVDGKTVDARFKDGVLTIRLNKLPGSGSRKIEVKNE